MFLGRPITFVHFQLPCQLLNSIRHRKMFTGEQRVKMDVVALPRLALEVRIGEVNAAVEEAVRRLGYNVPTTEQKDAVTAFISGRNAFVSLPRSGSKLLCYVCLPNLLCYMLTHVCIYT